MISRHLHLILAVVSVALTLLIAGPSQAQLHDVLVEPNNVVYSSTTEIQDGSEHMLVASTISNEATDNSLPQVRISRVKTDGTIDWEKDYAQETGWRAAHVMHIADDTGVLIGINPSLVNTGAARSIVMTFDLTTGAVLATAEIKEDVGANASEKGLVLTHGVYRNDKLALTGWLGGVQGSNSTSSVWRSWWKLMCPTPAKRRSPRTGHTRLTRPTTLMERTTTWGRTCWMSRASATSSPDRPTPSTTTP